MQIGVNREIDAATRSDSRMIVRISAEHPEICSSNQVFLHTRWTSMNKEDN